MNQECKIKNFKKTTQTLYNWLKKEQQTIGKPEIKKSKEIWSKSKFTYIDNAHQDAAFPSLLKFRQFLDNLAKCFQVKVIKWEDIFSCENTPAIHKKKLVIHHGKCSLENSEEPKEEELMTDLFGKFISRFKERQFSILNSQIFCFEAQSVTMTATPAQPKSQHRLHLRLRLRLRPHPRHKRRNQQSQPRYLKQQRKQCQHNKQQQTTSKKGLVSYLQSK